MKYYLIGKTLKHSHSLQIHNGLHNFNYDLLSLNNKSFINFMEKKDFKGLNVTIPYKNQVIPYLYYKDEIVNITSACNTIVNKNNKLYGYNTDYYGFLDLLNYYKIDIANKVCLILGSGSTSKSVYQALNNKKANKIYVVSRNKGLTYSKLNLIAKEVEIIINTTPFNMYPKSTNKSLIDLKMFNNLKEVIDVIYNPFRTKLLIDAKDLHINYHNGLYMLVLQAYYTEKIFKQKGILKKDAIRIYKNLFFDNTNIVLIGMPSSGKSKIGKMLALKLNKEFIDVDKEIEEKTNIINKDFILTYGEKEFRKEERKVISSLKNKKGVIISTGGGSILNKNNVNYLCMNGIIVYLNRKFKSLSVSDSRPLSNDYTKLKKLYKERLPLYKKYADIIIKDNDDEKIVNEIIRRCFNGKFWWFKISIKEK